MTQVLRTDPTRDNPDDDLFGDRIPALWWPSNQAVQRQKSYEGEPLPDNEPVMYIGGRGMTHGMLERNLGYNHERGPDQIEIYPDHGYWRWANGIGIAPALEQEAAAQALAEHFPDVVHKQQNMWDGFNLARTAGVAEYAEMVPVEAISHLREYDRRPGEPEAHSTPEYWEALKSHIDKNGFEDPITLEYNNESGRAKIGEGNHRLQIAEELGLTHVPVSCMRKGRDDPRMKPLTEPNAYPSDEYGYFPGYFKPSDIGLPVAGPYQDPGDKGWYKQQYPERFGKIARAIKLYHGTTNRAVERAEREGAFKPWDPRDVANEVATHYGLDPEEFYNHPYFEFSKARSEQEPSIYLTTSPKVAQSYAEARSEQLEDALHTAHRLLHPQLYEREGMDWKGERDRFKAQYHQAHDIQPQVVSFKVPEEALNNPPWEHGIETYTIPNEIPIDWMEQRTSNWHFAIVPQGFDYMYHASPQTNREKIQSEGLMGHKRIEDQMASPIGYGPEMKQPPGNYLFPELNDAVMYASSHGLGDIYRVNMHGLPLFPDPENRMYEGTSNLGEAHDPFSESEYDEDDKRWGYTPQRYLTPGHVHPSRLSLVSEDEGEESGDHEIPQVWDMLPFTERPMPGHEGSWHLGDYQGWTNWDTWHTKLLMDNERHLYEEQQRMAHEGWTPEQIRDWAVTHVIGPSNAQTLEDAKKYNSKPMEERRDPAWEELMGKIPEEKHQWAEDFIGGPNTGDIQPDEMMLMDPELVNWHEIHHHINSDYAEELAPQGHWNLPKPEVKDDQPGDLTIPQDWTAGKKLSVAHLLQGSGREEPLGGANRALTASKGSLPEKIAHPESTEDPDEEKWDSLYYGQGEHWANTHDYDPRWDYSDELRPEWHQHPLTKVAEERLRQHVGEHGRVFAADLQHRGDAVGMFIHGTGGDPVILYDPYQHERHTETPQEAHEQTLKTIDHEYRHAQQEQDAEGEPDYNEDDAEGWHFDGRVAHRLNWEPGTWGKGFIHNDELHTWPVAPVPGYMENDGFPSHAEYIQHLYGTDEDDYIHSPTWYGAFAIDKDGTTHMYEPKEGHQQFIESADPRLKVKAPEWDWEIGNTEPMATEPSPGVQIGNDEPGISTVNA